jgi:arylsulfatase A-like enzyme
MCSPSRATLFTGYFPAQHGVKWTLEDNMTGDQYPQAELPLPPELPNLATIMSAAGFSTPYRGKFHLTKPSGCYKPEDVNQYGFQGWDCPDAGANQDVDQFGGGYADHDKRYIEGTGSIEFGQEGVLQYLASKNDKSKPFFLTVSLVNPHDVLSYPQTAYYNGYSPEWVKGDIGLPSSSTENLQENHKPSAQNQFLTISNSPGGFGTLDAQQQLDYINFYGNLMKSSDAYLVKIIEALKEQGLLDNTLIIKTADHGEMGLAHGGMRQKNFNMYEETLRVPLTFSNPNLFKGEMTCNALVSHVDFLPTMASLFEAPPAVCADWQGVDYSSLIFDPNGKPVQDYTVFTFDDYQSGQTSNVYPRPNNHIVSIREENFKLAQYYSLDDPQPAVEWEMYDLAADPNEMNNLAYNIDQQSQPVQDLFKRLQDKLNTVVETRLQPFPASASSTTA